MMRRRDVFFWVYIRLSLRTRIPRGWKTQWITHLHCIPEYQTFYQVTGNTGFCNGSSRTSGAACIITQYVGKPLMVCHGCCDLASKPCSVWSVDLGDVVMLELGLSRQSIIMSQARPIEDQARTKAGEKAEA